MRNGLALSETTVAARANLLGGFSPGVPFAGGGCLFGAGCGYVTVVVAVEASGPQFLVPDRFSLDLDWSGLVEVVVEVGRGRCGSRYGGAWSVRAEVVLWTYWQISPEQAGDTSCLGTGFRVLVSGPLCRLLV